MNYLEVYFNGVLKQSIHIQTDVISIGRSSSNDIVINNMGVSNHHAVITKKDGLFFVEDFNSTNGTFLNSQKISSQQRITLQDSIVIGKHTLKLSEWSQSNNTASTASYQESDDATVMMNRAKTAENKPGIPPSSEQQFYFLVKGEQSGMNKLLLTQTNYGIGKAKDNKIRLSGWFIPAYIAEIEKIGHTFYISPLKKNKVKLNGQVINSTMPLSASDEIRVKKLFLKFSTD